MRKLFKNIKVVIIFGVFILGLSGCKDFITRSYQDRPSPDNYVVNDKSSAKQLVVASYNPWNYGSSNMFRKELIIASDALSDDGDTRFNGSDRIQLRNWTFQPNNAYMEDWWQYPYQSINAANYAIEKISNGGLTQEKMAPYIAEARFMRGYDYLFLVTFFGKVPLITHHLSSLKEYDNPRASVDSLYDQIISDFSFAKENLLKDENDFKGTPTKATGAAYLAKAYLYKGDYKNAETAARDAILIAKNTGYHLVDDYQSIFDINNEGNPELLFYFSFERNSELYGGPMSVERNVRDLPPTLNSVQGSEGWGYALPTRDLYDAYEKGDPRRGYTIYAPGDFFGIYNKSEPFTYNYETYNENGELKSYEITYQAGDTVRYHWPWSPTGMNVKKLTENLNGLSNVRYGGLDQPVMRMADLYLILAEALAEQGKNEALKWVNKVRARPSVNMPPKTPSDGSLIDIVRHERRVELGMEGQRIWDLVRWGKAKNIFGNGKKVKLNFFSDYLEKSSSNRFLDPTPGLSKYPSEHVLFPIPQYEVDHNSMINTNNPGY